MGTDGILPRRLLSVAVRAVESRPGCAQSGGAGRSSQQPLLFLFYRAVAAGGLLLHRTADPRGHYAVPHEFRGRTHLVRISLSANGVDGSVLRRRAPDRRRPSRAPEERRRAWHAEPGALRGNYAEALDLADDRLVDRRRLGALFKRCANAGEAACHLPG